MANKRKKHTPGPWVITNKTEKGIVLSEGADGFRIALVHNDDSGLEEADALLIAAAPDLLIALKRVREDINWMLNNEKFLNPHVFRYIDHALDKAEKE